MRKIDINKLNNVDDLLDVKYGEEGSASREEFKREAIAYYYGELLKEKRKELHFTQEVLAEKAGLKRSYIAKIERGETDMQISSLVRIAEALGMKLTLS